MLFQALEIDTPAYAHVSTETMLAFKQLIARYPNAFYLPNTNLSAVTGFQHNIDTGDPPPVYRLPYRKSPAELKAIKEELERMLCLCIIKPSHNALLPASDPAAMPDLALYTVEFGNYLNSLSSKPAISSQACKFVYEHLVAARQLLASQGKLLGLVKAFPYLQLDGGAHGGTYVISLNSDLFAKINSH